MKTFTRLAALVLVLALAFSMAACASAEVKIAAKADLDGKVIGTQLGTTGDTIANEQVKAKSVESFKLFVDAVQSLKQKKVDAVIMDRFTAEVFTKQNTDLEIVDVGFDAEEYAIAVDKGNSELLAKVNEALSEMKANGALEASVNAHADETGSLPDLNAGAAGGKLVMGTSAGFPPFEYLDDKNQVVGVDVDIMAAVAKKLDMELVVENMDFDGLIPALNGGKIVAIAAGMTVTEERQVNVDFSETYFDASQVVVVRKAQ
ncbi:MAG: transporter substrate-binding domain-containing protein [Clostridia bacterium]|nr:transporter substrate-binding domain-containing protein [Clostridia bacterium]NCC75347.1 transporter substrate-binding domain-containing protein [Clostridia bacterium]